jgi:hypothetical protein
MYRQYKELIHKDAEKNDNHVYGTDQLAAQLTVAHMLDHMVCLFKKDEFPILPEEEEKVKNWVSGFGTWEDKFEDSAETEIMRNNFKITSTYFPRICKCCGGIQTTATSFTTGSTVETTASNAWGTTN